MPGPAQAAARPSTGDWIRAFGSPIALGTALMLYFGWVRSEAQARAFGADASVFEMSTQDLVLRSINVLFLPVIGLLLLSLLAMRLDPWFRERARPLVPVLRWSWLLAPAGLLHVAIWDTSWRLLLPLWSFLAIGGTVYGGVLRRHLAADGRPMPTRTYVVVVLLLTVTLFWQTERLAAAAGQDAAHRIKADPGTHLNPVTLFATTPLPTEARGVVETVVATGEAERYRYDGLYLLQRSGGKYFLLSDGWQPGVDQGRLLVVPDSEDVRLEFGG